MHKTTQLDIKFYEKENIKRGCHIKFFFNLTDSQLSVDSWR